MRRFSVLAVAVSLVSCRQATPAEVGAQSTRDAHPIATMRASERRYEASPVAISPAVAGRPLAQPR